MTYLNDIRAAAADCVSEYYHGGDFGQGGFVAAENLQLKLREQLAIKWDVCPMDVCDDISEQIQNLI